MAMTLRLADDETDALRRRAELEQRSMQEVARQSEGKYKLGPGTLYDNLQKLMKRPAIVDLRNIYRTDEMKRAKFRYIGVGRAGVD